MPITDIDDNLCDFSDLVSIEAFSAFADNLNSMIDAVAPGEIATFFVVDGVTPELDPTIWQECDGSEITEPLSKLRGEFVPDMRGRYLRGATSLSQVGLPGGSNETNLFHNHGGSTEASGVSGHADESSAYWSAVEHAHAVGGDMGPTNMEPRHFTIKHYFKIR